MVGHQVAWPKREAGKTGDVVLEAIGASLVKDEVTRLSDLNFKIRAGETLGIIGVSGNGQAQLAHLVSGLSQASSGELRLFDEPIADGVEALMKAGVGRIPEDRNAEGAIGEMTLWENAILDRVRSPRFSRNGFVDHAAARAFASIIIE